MKPTIQTPVFQVCIFIDKDANFRVKINDNILPEKFSYYDESYFFIEEKVFEFFEPMREAMSNKQGELIIKEKRD